MPQLVSWQTKSSRTLDLTGAAKCCCSPYRSLSRNQPAKVSQQKAACAQDKLGFQLSFTPQNFWHGEIMMPGCCKSCTIFKGGTLLVFHSISPAGCLNGVDSFSCPATSHCSYESGVQLRLCCSGCHMLSVASLAHWWPMLLLRSSLISCNLSQLRLSKTS